MLAGLARSAVRAVAGEHPRAIAAVALGCAATIALVVGRDARTALSIIAGMVVVLGFDDVRVRVLAVVAGAVVLLHRDGLAGPKTVYLAIAVAAVVAALPAAREVLAGRTRTAERRVLYGGAALGLLVMLSLPVALVHSTDVVTWSRDASAYGLLAAAPLLAIDLRRVASLIWVRWLLVGAGGLCAVSFISYWLTLREYATVPAELILLPSLYLPAGLVAYATAHAFDGERYTRAAWCGLAVAIAMGIAATGTRTFMLLLAAPLAQTAVRGRHRWFALLACALALVAVAAVSAAATSAVDSRGAIGRLASVGTFLGDPAADPSMRERIDQGSDALHAWRESPLVGVGPGHMFHWRTVRGRPQSSFLIDSPAGYAAKFGVVGLVVFVLFASSLALAVRERLRVGGESSAGAEGLVGLSAIALCGLVFGLPLEDKGFSLAVLLLLALASPRPATAVVSPDRLRRPSLRGEPVPSAL